MPNVLIADDEEFVRYYLKGLLESKKDYKVIEEIDTGDGLFEMIQETRPDILLLDINMPNMRGDEFLKAYGKSFKNLCIIILTISASFSLKSELMDMGYENFMRKDTSPEEILKYIDKTWNDFLRKKNTYG